MGKYRPHARLERVFVDRNGTHNDLSENAVKQADETIEKRELIKCSVLDGSGLTAKEAGEGLAEQLGAELVQVIGNRFVLYRRSQRDDVEHIRLVRE